MSKLLLSFLVAAAVVVAAHAVGPALGLSQAEALGLAAYAASVAFALAALAAVAFAASVAASVAFASFTIPAAVFVSAAAVTCEAGLAVGILVVLVAAIPAADKLGVKRRWALAAASLGAAAAYAGLYWSAPWLALASLAAAYAGLYLASRRWPSAFAAASPA